MLKKNQLKLTENELTCIKDIMLSHIDAFLPEKNFLSRKQLLNQMIAQIEDKISQNALSGDIFEKFDFGKEIRICQLQYAEYSEKNNLQECMQQIINNRYDQNFIANNNGFNNTFSYDWNYKWLNVQLKRAQNKQHLIQAILSKSKIFETKILLEINQAFHKDELNKTLKCLLNIQDDNVQFQLEDLIKGSNSNISDHQEMLVKHYQSKLRELIAANEFNSEEQNILIDLLTELCKDFITINWSLDNNNRSNSTIIQKQMILIHRKLLLEKEKNKTNIEQYTNDLYEADLQLAIFNNAKAIQQMQLLTNDKIQYQQKIDLMQQEKIKVDNQLSDAQNINQRMQDELLQLNQQKQLEFDQLNSRLDTEQSKNKMLLKELENLKIQNKALSNRLKASDLEIQQLKSQIDSFRDRAIIYLQRIKNRPIIHQIITLLKSIFLIKNTIKKEEFQKILDHDTSSSISKL